MSFISDKTCCAQRNKNHPEPSYRDKRIGLSEVHATLSMGSPLPAVSDNPDYEIKGGQFGRVNAFCFSPALLLPQPFSEGAHLLPCLSTPPILHYTTDDLSDRRLPARRFPLPAFSENKASSPFYLHPAAAPVHHRFFSKDRLPAPLARLCPVEPAASSELTVLTFLPRVIFLKHDNRSHEDTANLFRKGSSLRKKG